MGDFSRTVCVLVCLTLIPSGALLAQQDYAVPARLLVFQSAEPNAVPPRASSENGIPQAPTAAEQEVQAFYDKLQVTELVMRELEREVSELRADIAEELPAKIASELAGNVELERRIKSLIRQLATSSDQQTLDRLTEQGQLIEEQAKTIEQLRSNLNGQHQNNSGSLGTQPSGPVNSGAGPAPQWVHGVVIVENHCSYPVDVRINGQFKRIGPGTYSYPIWVSTVGGVVYLEIPGFQPPTAFPVSGPSFTATVPIVPR